MCRVGAVRKTVVRTDSGSYDDIENRWRSIALRLVKRARSRWFVWTHLYRTPIDDGGALAVETARFRDIYNRVRPHQALGNRTPRQAYLHT